MKLSAVRTSYTCTLKQPLSDSELDDKYKVRESSDELPENVEVYQIEELRSKGECESQISEAEGNEYRVIASEISDTLDNEYELTTSEASDTLDHEYELTTSEISDTHRKEYEENVSGISDTPREECEIVARAISDTQQGNENDTTAVAVKSDFQVISVYPSEGGDTRSQWKLLSKGGKHQMFHDEEIGVKVWEIKGASILSVYGLAPKNAKASLKINLPIMYLLIKYDALIFCFEIKFLDSHMFRRRFRFSNFYKEAHKDIFSTKMPLEFFDGWNIVQVDLAKLTRAVYGTSLREVETIEMHANVRIGRISFINRMLHDEEIPEQFQSCAYPIRNHPVIEPSLVSVYSPQFGNFIDYKNIYGPSKSASSTPRAIYH